MVPSEAERARSGADDRLEGRRDLPDGPLRVPGRDRDVAEVRDRERAEDLCVLRRVVGEARSRRPDGLGPEARPGAVRRRGVEGDAEHGDVDAVGVVDERAARERLDARVPRRGQRVGRAVAGAWSSVGTRRPYQRGRSETSPSRARSLGYAASSWGMLGLDDGDSPARRLRGMRSATSAPAPTTTAPTQVATTRPSVNVSATCTRHSA